MRKRILFSLFVLIPFLFIVLSSLAVATKSRLMGMGDLSIVIEDESNMINLWDFGRNPAAFLEDEKASVIRGDMYRERYSIEDLFCLYDECGSRSRCRAVGDVLRSLVSIDMRKEDDFAFGIQGTHFVESREFQHKESELEHPGISLVFSKSLNRLTSVGIDLTYAEYAPDERYTQTGYHISPKMKYYQIEFGVKRKLTTGVELGGLLGHHKVDKDPNLARSDFSAYWLCLQSAIDVKQKLRLGIETALELRREDLPYTQGKEDSYYCNHLILRGIYDLTERLCFGIFYHHNQEITSFAYPLEWEIWPVSSYRPAATHWGAGCSYRLNSKAIAGLEYHFIDNSEFYRYYPYRGYMHWSYNSGLEIQVLRDLSLRAGYIGCGTNSNPGSSRSVQDVTWQNSLTLGIGYHSHRSNWILEIAYRYDSKTFEEWYGHGDVHAKTHAVSASFRIDL